MLAAWIEEDPDDLPMPPDDLRAESTARIDRRRRRRAGRSRTRSCTSRHVRR